MGPRSTPQRMPAPLAAALAGGALILLLQLLPQHHGAATAQLAGPALVVL